MGEALAILTGVAGLLDITARASSHVRTLMYEWKNAPFHFQALFNEINDSNLVLDHVKTACEAIITRTGDGIGTLGQALDNQIKKSEPVWLEVNKLLGSIGSISSTGTIQMHRGRWYRQKRRAGELQNDLRNARLRFMELLTSYNALSGTRIEVAIESVRLQAEQENQSIALRNNHAIQRLTEVLARLDTLDSTVHNAALHPILNKLTDSVEDIRSSLVHRSQSGEASGSQEPSKSTLAANEASQATRELQQFPHHELKAKGNDEKEHSDSNCTTPNAFSLRKNNLGAHSSFQTVQIQAWKMACNSSLCPCKCHQYRVGRRPLTPLLLRRLFGTMFIGYSGFPVFGVSCDDASCNSTRSKTVEIVYCFPAWFPGWALHAAIALSATGEPQAGLFLRRRISDHSEEYQTSIPWLARNGNSDGIKVVLMKRLGSVRDVNTEGGSTALHGAIANGRIDTIKLLLSEGADPYDQDDLGQPAIQDAVLCILGRTGTPQLRHELETILPWSKYVDSSGFSQIHKVVLGICPLDLHDTLENYSNIAKINSHDAHGMTPLHWAALRGDDRAVHELLLRRPNIEALGRRKETPLMEAARGSSPQCVEQLVKADADVKWKDDRGITALHTACEHGSLAHVKPILSAGALVNDADNVGQVTPIQCAIARDNSDILAYLLEIGAEIDHGNTPGADFRWAISNNAYKSIKTLLRTTRANHTAINRWGQSILHVTARDGDAETMRILTKAQLNGLDTERKDENGRSPLQILDERPGVTEELKRVYDTLLKTVYTYRYNDDTLPKPTNTC